MSIIEKFRISAKHKNRTIVLPEGGEERIIKAAGYLAEHELVKPILLGDESKIKSQSDALGINISNVKIEDPQKSPMLDPWTDDFFNLRKHKNITRDEARSALLDPLFFGAFMVRTGKADGAVAGSINTTGNVLRAGIQVIGLADNVSVVSSSFIMSLKQEKILTFADCAVIPDPDEDQLASIAISSAKTHSRLVDEEPRIAMLSFSTKGSAKHPNVDKVIGATSLVSEKDPTLIVDGELQFDAAFLESVGKKKAPGSPVAGNANVLIFPDLNSGNIGYKIAQRLGEAEAIGPIIQGLKHPFNDLSRGCSVEDVINVSCICALMS